MKLYELQHSQWVKLILPKPEKKEKEDNVRWEREKPKEEGIQVPSTAIPLDKDAIIFFDHVDGMYSLCWDTEGNMVHPAAWTEVEVIIGHKQLRKLITWGGRGKNNDEPLTNRTIQELSDDHLINLLEYSKTVSIRPDILTCIQDEKIYRDGHGITVPEY